MKPALQVAGLALVALVSGVCGAFVHHWAAPGGLVLALSGSAGLAVLARAFCRSRIGLGVVSALWLVPVVLLAMPRGEGDLVIDDDLFGGVFIFGGVVIFSIVLGMGAERPRIRSVT